MAGLDWHGDAAVAAIRAELARRLEAGCKLVAARAYQLLSVAGTGTRQQTSAEIGRAAGKKARSEARAATRAEVKRYNEAHAAGIKIGAIKRARMTKAGTFTTIRKSRKKG